MLVYDYKYIAEQVHRVQTGNSDAFAELYTATYQELYARIRERVDNSWQALDLMTEIYVEALRRIRELKEPRQFMHWLDRLADEMIGQKSGQDAEKGREGAAPDDKGGRGIADRTANQVLQEVLVESEMEPTVIPVEMIAQWGNYMRPIYRKTYIFLGVCMAVLFLMPLLFLHAKISTKRIPSDTSDSIDYTIQVKSILPVRAVYARMNGRGIDLEEGDDDAYHATLTANGTLEVTAVLANGQTTKQDYAISFIDTEKPVFVGYDGDDKTVRITVRDTFSGVDYENISGGEVVSWDEDTGVVELEIPDEKETVVIPDRAGNELRLVLSPVAGDDEEEEDGADVEGQDGKDDEEEDAGVEETADASGMDDETLADSTEVAGENAEYTELEPEEQPASMITIIED